MYKFLLLQWKAGKVTAENLSQAVLKGWISEEEKEQMLATPLD